jgi:inner membrane protein
VPSLITHSLVGIAAGKTLSDRKMPLKFWGLSVLCATLPDADVIGFFLHVPYGHFFGHRGFFHSPFFGLLVSLLVITLFFREKRPFSASWWGYLAYFFLVSASHGLLDALTNGGLGIALLSPFDSTRYFFSKTPIVVSPLGIRAFFSEWGLRVIMSEIFWVWIPTCMLVMLSRLIRFIYRRREGRFS